MSEITWRAALDEAAAELDSVEAQLQMLRTRADALRLAITGLRTLLGEDSRGTLEAHVHGERHAIPNPAILDLPPAAMHRVKLLRDATKSGKLKDSSSTDLAAALLVAVGRPLSMLQIRTLFQLVGWVDDEWKNSSANIHMAVRRGLDRGLVSRLPDGRWVAVEVNEPKTIVSRKKEANDAK
jgi:hypothetical protein